VTTALSNFDIVSDAELARAAATGDRGAFAMIYDRYADRLHDFCVGMLRDRDAAADCVQDVFCTAATQLPKLREPDRLRPWLYAIARNEALRCIRDRRREHASDELPDEASHDAGPDTLAARNELANLIAEAAGGLVDRDRTVLELAYRHGLDGPELANALEVSPGTANKMVSRLRNTIESSLGALLVARRAQQSADKCAELGAILADWDGRFSVLMRKRISRHIESCSTCDEERRRLVNPVALLGAAPVFIPAPAWLRDHTLGQIQLTSADFDLDASDSADDHGQSGDTDHSDGGRDDAGHLDGVQPGRGRRVIPWVGLFAAAFFLSLGLMYTFLYHDKTAVTPMELRGTVPSPVKQGPPPTANLIPATAPANPVPPSPPVNSPAPVQLPTAPPPVAPPPPPIAPPPIVPPVAPPPPPIVPPPPVVLPPPVIVPPPPIVLPPPVRVTPPVYPPPSPPVYPPPSPPVYPPPPPVKPTPPSSGPIVPPHRGPILTPPAGPTYQPPPPAQPPPPPPPPPPAKPPPPPPSKGPVIN
jgi:RNA polymerase sigma factor (sigma-70 family)